MIAVFCASVMLAAPVELHVQGLAEPPALDASLAPIVELELRAAPPGSTIAAMSIRAANKRGDPERLTVIDAGTGAPLGHMALAAPAGKRPVYRLEDAVAMPADGRIRLAAPVTENWARLASRRKLSRTLTVTVQDAAGSPLGLTLIAKKRPAGVDHKARADVTPEQFGAAHATGMLMGMRTGDEPDTWVVPAGEYTITSDLVVPRDVTLRFEAGATIRLAVGRSIVAYGRIVADGTAAAPVSFVPRGGGAWGSLAFQGSRAAGSILRGIRILRGSQSYSGKSDRLGAVDVFKSTLVVEDSSFEDTRGEDALHVLEGRLEVRRTRFVNAASDAVDFDDSNGVVEDCVFSHIADDAMDFSDAWAAVRRVRVDKTGGKAITAGPRARLLVEDSMFVSVGRGISSFDGSAIDARRLAIVRPNKAALEAAHREGEDPGTISISRSLIWKAGAADEGEARITRRHTRDDLRVDIDRYSPVRVGNEVLGPPPFDGAPPVLSEAAAQVTSAPEGPTGSASMDAGAWFWWLLGALGLLAVTLGADRYARLRR